MFMNRKKSQNEISETKQADLLENETETEDIDSKKTKRRDMFLGIFSVILALTIWLYASAINETEIKLQSPVNLKYVLDAENKGYVIQYNPETKVDFTLKGKALALSQITGKNIISADLSTINYSEIGSEKIVQLPLTFHLPEGVTCSEKSKEYIEIIIVKNN